MTLLELGPGEVEELLRLAARVRELRRMGIPHEYRRGRTLFMLFEKPSTRTRVSLGVAAMELGMGVIYASPGELQLGRGEPISDTARTLSRYVHAVAMRVSRHETLEEFARHSEVPVINALSDRHHPLQALADALTLWDVTGRLRGLRVAFLGDIGNNVATSLAIIGAKLGWEVRLIGPRRLYRDVEKLVSEDLSRTGAKIVVSESVEDVAGVDAVYTDVWVSMGAEGEAEERRRLLEPYRVTRRVMELAGPRAVFMHCLPARRGEEVEAEVIDGERSVVWLQAENRLHTAKAVLLTLVK